MTHLRAARGLGFSTSAVVLALAFTGACSGSSATIGGSDVADSAVGPTGDASSPTNDGATSADGSTLADASPVDAGVDASVSVEELPAPDCNDLPQLATDVSHVASATQPPAQVPITTIAPGYYVLTSATDYGGATVVDSTSSRTTVAFTAMRQYYRSEGGSSPAQVLTLDWTISNNRLLRKVVCAQAEGQVGATVDYRIDAAPNGFIIYVPYQGGGSGPIPRTQAFRYQRAK